MVGTEHQPEKPDDKIAMWCDRRRVGCFSRSKPSRTAVMAGPGKPGRPSKGPRKRVEVKMPIPLAELLEQHVRRNGQDVSDWVVSLVAERLDFPLNRQERLPLSDAA